MTSRIAYPKEWDNIDLKDIRVSLIETLRQITTIRCPIEDDDLVIQSASFIFDDLGVCEELIPWCNFLFADENDLFKRFVADLDLALSCSSDIRFHPPISAQRLSELKTSAELLSNKMAEHGLHNFM